MSETFSGVARRLAGLVPHTLGWRPHEFWEATPAELAAILAVFRQAQSEREGGVPLTRTEVTALLERERDG